jgi:hypothetical protein
MFIVNPYAWDCGRFEVDPTEVYGLTKEEAQELKDLNVARNLAAFDY